MNLTVRYWLLIRFSGAWVKVLFHKTKDSLFVPTAKILLCCHTARNWWQP